MTADGTSDYSVRINQYGGAPNIVDLTAFVNEGDWRHDLDKFGEAKVRATNIDEACCRKLGFVRPWLHELQIQRNGHTVFVGPVQTPFVPPRAGGNLEIIAADMPFWLTARFARLSVDWTAAGLGAQPVDSIVDAIVQMAMIPADPGFLAFYEVLSCPTLHERVIDADPAPHELAWDDHLAEIIGSLMHMSVHGRQTTFFCKGECLGVLPSMNDLDFVSFPTITRDGDRYTTSMAVIGAPASAAPACPSPSITQAPIVVGAGTTLLILDTLVNPEGVATSAIVQVGTTPGGTTFSVGPVALGAGTTAVSIPAIFNALAPSTTYWYRVTATNACGTTTSTDALYTTPANAGTPTIVDTTAAGCGATPNALALSGDINPNGLATIYWAEYGLDQTYGFTTPPLGIGAGVVPVPVLAAPTGLIPNTNYHWRWHAQNANGVSVSADVVCRTTVAPAPAPDALGLDVYCTGVTSTTLSTTGQITPNGLATNVFVEYGLTPGGPYPFSTPPVAIGAGVVPVTVATNLTGLTPSTTYYWRLVGVNANNTNSTIERSCTTDPVVAPTSTPIVGVAGGINALGLLVERAVILDGYQDNLSAAVAAQDYVTSDAPLTIFDADDARLVISCESQAHENLHKIRPGHCFDLSVAGCVGATAAVRVDGVGATWQGATEKPFLLLSQLV